MTRDLARPRITEPPIDGRTSISLRALLDDAPFLLLAAVYSAIAIASHAMLGIPQSLHLTLLWSSVGVQTIVYAIAVFVLVCIHAVIVRRHSLRASATWRGIFATVVRPGSSLSYAVLFVAFGPLMHSFIAYKISIPVVHPFSWDVRFMEWDQLLHLGRHPFSWLQSILAHPVITALIDDIYYAWLPVTWFTVIWQAWHGRRDTPTRSQFLVAFALCWMLLGTVLATLLSSAGPVYFGEVTDHSDPYVPLFEYLHSVDAQFDLHALSLQDLLWAVYRNPELTGLGISAMPSLHVSIASLMVLLGFSVHRWLGWAYLMFALLILVGSVHLGWHYAIDGYVGALLTIPIWKVSGTIVRWWRHRVGLGPPVESRKSYSESAD